MRVRTCPYCGLKYDDVPVTSQKDNKTLICPDCGAREALDIFGLKDAEKEKIIEIMHRGKRHEKN